MLVIVLLELFFVLVISMLEYVLIKWWFLIGVFSILVMMIIGRGFVKFLMILIVFFCCVFCKRNVVMFFMWVLSCFIVFGVNVLLMRVCNLVCFGGFIVNIFLVCMLCFDEKSLGFFRMN